ncbi:MAG: carboxypeptidase regulatory-like domain-containing protein [Candidatus Wallbacteria bacterium]|nr:carboxypeptidase regulatory-like domain-containing protein [Candidatus Wallbacteria bacterium]
MARAFRMGVLVFLVWSLAGAPAALAGSGVSNGAIQGVAYASGGEPLGGVSVVAVREEAPPIIRSAVTDEMGNFFLGDLYVGTYTLGFSKYGFRTITTQQGDPQNRTALGSQVRAFVEPGRVSTVGSVRLVPDAAAFGGTVTVQVADSVTGEPVEDASVIVGPSAANGPGPGGRYVLQVPPTADPNGGLAPVRAIVQADGFAAQESLVTLAPNSNTNVFFRLQPAKALLTGQVRLGFGIPLEEITQVRVLVANVDPNQASGRVVDTSGNFEVSVPASTSTRVRNFTLLFVLNGARVATVANVIAPRAGARTLPGPVPIDPVTTTLAGQVVLSDGTLPSGLGFDQAVVLELGRAFPLLNGTFQIPGVPVGRTFNIQVQATNPFTRRVELGQLQVTAVSDGSPNPVFQLPLIVTRAGGFSFVPPF